MIDPRSMTEPVTPPYGGGSALARIGAEIWDHLWPWSRNGFQRQRAIQLLTAVAAARAEDVSREAL